MTSRNRVLVWLAGLGLVDILIPVPIVALTLAYVVLERPPWFRRLVAEVYDEPPGPR
jgi:hypothetical protein